MSSRRPRRSRIYDSNYNIGENYYKSAIDRLDEKYSSRPSILLRHSEPPAVSPPRPRFLAAAIDGLVEEEDLDYSRDRASHAIRKETVLDQFSGRKGLELESSFDDQVHKTLGRIQASKKLLNSIDVDQSYLDDASAASKAVTFKKRSVKVTSDYSNAAEQSSTNALTKWSKNSDYNDSESFAAVRARQSAARLLDIEQDMQDRSDRQFAREQRVASARKLLAESDFDSSNALTNGVSSLKISQKSTRKQVSTF